MTARLSGPGLDSLNRPDISPQVAEQAVNWLLEMQSGHLDSGRQHAWPLWLNSHSDDQRAWGHIQRVNQRLHGLSSPLADAAINAPKSGSRRQALKLLLLLGAGSVPTWSARDRLELPPLLADYRSSIGKRRKVAVADGRPLQLNTDTALDVRFDSGQGLTAEGSLRAAGSGARFNVHQLRGRTQLAVFAGSVELSPTERVGADLMVNAAQQVSLNRSGWEPVRPVDAASGAWVDGIPVPFAPYGQPQLSFAPVSMGNRKTPASSRSTASSPRPCAAAISIKAALCRCRRASTGCAASKRAFPKVSAGKHAARRGGRLSVHQRSRP
ncbi:DUF4880 domain-containing protein [Pseudomonas sp. LP_7_YM]|uniref:DUF4880 domain-containing protein n=1 Tax=Pseudomonas sp. LP_7_YM TaxID=2485137 RepID=UPI0010D5747D|nr:DUF4880 domain-containing protein [Pseudomonas sp. LP_7_YM]TDV69825.1 FecR family protein [Pseudomonas sp. LP_7_YM]